MNLGWQDGLDGPLNSAYILFLLSVRLYPWMPLSKCISILARKLRHLQPCQRVEFKRITFDVLSKSSYIYMYIYINNFFTHHPLTHTPLGKNTNTNLNKGFYFDFDSNFTDVSSSWTMNILTNASWLFNGQSWSIGSDIRSGPNR